MRADHIGNHGLERGEGGMCQMLGPRIRVGPAQLFAGMGIKYRHGFYGDTRKDPLWDRRGTPACTSLYSSDRPESTPTARLSEARHARIFTSFPSPHLQYSR